MTTKAVARPFMDRPSIFGLSIPDKIPQKDAASKQGGGCRDQSFRGDSSFFESYFDPR
jgi:hypothetical protein